MASVATRLVTRSQTLYRLAKRHHQDRMLDLDVDSVDGLYRLLHAQKIVYVQIIPTDILPEKTRHYGYALVRWLAQFQEWRDDDWTTLTIRRDGGRLRLEKDTWPAHRISHEFIRPQHPKFDVLDLAVLDRMIGRVSRVRFGSTTAFVKIARFKHELKAMQREIAIYHELADRGSSQLAARFLGYVYDGDPQRVIGFLVEEVAGRASSIGDLAACTHALSALHGVGILHGDVGRHNMLVTASGAVTLIDFELSRIKAGVEDWDGQTAHEMSLVEAALKDESGTGKPVIMEWW